MDLEKIKEEKINKLKDISELLEIEKRPIKREMLVIEFYTIFGYLTALKDILKDGDINGEKERS